MATGPITQISDVVVPAIFTPYSQQLTEQKARLIQSGAIVRDAELDRLLAGGGLTFNAPSYKDLDNDAERTSTDTPSRRYSTGDGATYTNPQDPDPLKIGTGTEIAVRVNRNNSWSSADLTSVLSGSDPMNAIASRVSYYWTRRLQAAFIAVMTGVFANNAAATDSFHVQNDMTYDIKGGAFAAGVTDFSATAFLGAALTMGDSQDALGMVMVHSVVYNKMQNNNLIDFIPDAEGKVNIPTFLGREVIVDDAVPSPSAGVYETWLFGAGAVRFGVGSPKIPTEIERLAGAGNGGGSETLYNRVEWCLHPAGNAYIGTAPNGGPSNAASANNFAAAGSWKRIFPERKQIKIARLITREA
jgi:hypothetical protein